MLGLLILKTNDFSCVVLLGLYGVDSILTIIHRILLRENILTPHRKHQFQMMANELKMPHVHVSGMYCLVQALIVVGSILTDYRYEYLLGVILLLSGVYVWFMRRYFKLQGTTPKIDMNQFHLCFSVVEFHNQIFVMVV